jgi:hypothetical protein
MYLSLTDVGTVPNWWERIRFRHREVYVFEKGLIRVFGQSKILRA